jgi:protein TonB
VKEQATPLLPRLGDEITATYKEPLTPTMKRAVLAAVIFFHVGGGWALTQVEPVKLVVGDIAPMEVRMVAAEQPAQVELPMDEPPPLPEVPPPPPDLATVVDPPPPDLPSPVFPVEAPPPPPPEPPPPKPPEPPKPKPPQPKPVQKAAPAPRPAADAQPQQATAAPPGPPAAPVAPKTVSASQLGYLVPPNPIYPARSRKAGEQGSVTIRVLIDVTGRPAQASLQTSSGHAALDESALSAVRAAQFKPYAEGGLPQAVWVLVPINFVLR